MDLAIFQTELIKFVPRAKQQMVTGIDHIPGVGLGLNDLHIYNSCECILLN